MDIKSGYLKGAKIFGHKTVSWFGANKEKGLPDLVGVIVVFDATNGLPIGILDGGYITGLRTGAAGAIGAKYLARPESETLFVLGAGNQAAFQIAAMLTLFPGLKKILVADMLDPQNAERFIEALPKRLAEEFGIDASDVTLEANSKLEEAVPQADVIITVTPSPRSMRSTMASVRSARCWGTRSEAPRKMTIWSLPPCLALYTARSALSISSLALEAA